MNHDSLENGEDAGRCPKWYVCQTNPKQESTADSWLRKAGYETLFLRYWGTHSHARRETPIILPLFPRYLFVAVGGQGFRSAALSPGVHSRRPFVSNADGPKEVPEEVMDYVRGMGDSNGLVVLSEPEKKKRKLMKCGQKVNVTRYPFNNVAGTVKLDKHGVIAVWIEILGGQSVDFLPCHVSPAVAKR